MYKYTYTHNDTWYDLWEKKYEPRPHEETSPRGPLNFLQKVQAVSSSSSSSGRSDPVSLWGFSRIGGTFTHARAGARDSENQSCRKRWDFSSIFFFSITRIYTRCGNMSYWLSRCIWLMRGLFLVYSSGAIWIFEILIWKSSKLIIWMLNIVLARGLINAIEFQIFSRQLLYILTIFRIT